MAGAKQAGGNEGQSVKSKDGSKEKRKEHEILGSTRSKRKRAETLTGPCEPSADSVSDARAGDASKKMGQQERKQEASRNTKTAKTTTRASQEWPAWLQELEKTHRALNVVYTFCCTRKHLLTTFATIQTAVEAHTKAALTEANVAAIASLLAQASGGEGVGIRFEYVDELSLHMDVLGSERDEVFTTGRHRPGVMAAAPAADASVGGITGRLDVWPAGTGSSSPAREVLFFEFVDEDLKRQVPDPKTGEPVRPTQLLRNERLRMPVFGQKQMASLIEKRNRRFSTAVNAFLDRCEADGLAGETEIEALLQREAAAFLPRSSVAGEAAGEAEGEAEGGAGQELDGAGGSTDSGLPSSIPEERKSMVDIVQELRGRPWYSGQIVPDGHRVVEEQEAVYGHLDFLMSQDLVNALYNAKGITQFYAHQAEAINALHAGQHVVVATSTSSGKSLIYQLPVVHALEQDRQARALYIFPTKALAQDQKRSLRDLVAYMPGLYDYGGDGGDPAQLVETFDGDTPWKERNQIRETARVIFTNPDMLHATILPQEQRWRAFLQNLHYVVVDELHYYNGLMGSHMAYIMRRLRRLCAAVGNRDVRIVACSATVANPVEHFETIFGVMDWERGAERKETVRLVDSDGSPTGRKEFLCWNTPFRVPEDPASGRGSGLQECSRLFCELILRGVRVIAFCRVREQCEKLVGAVHEELARLGRASVAPRVMGYRGGYTPPDRRRIEADMFSGRLVGIVATTALELGVDIGALDCVLSWGFPYSLANLRQQSGRAGRRLGRDSLSILVGDAFATDQYYMQNPDALFSQPLAALQVDLDNMLVREGHVQCAAYELPVKPDADVPYLGAGLAELCAERLECDDLGFYHCHASFRPQPWRLVAIRGVEDETFAIVDVGRSPPVVLEELEASRATFTLYDGAIFLHQGTTYLVQDFDPDKRVARVERVKVDWTTQQRDYTDVDPILTQAVRRIGGSFASVEGEEGEEKVERDCGRAYLGRIRITQVVFGYFKVDKRERILDAVQVDNPPVVRQSRGTWMDVPASGLAVLARRRMHVAAAIHAAEHAVLGLLPNFVVSLPGDVGTECKSSIKEFQKRSTPSRRQRPARLVFYDAHGGAGGIGIAAKAFDFVDALLLQALERIENCACGLGLPLRAAADAASATTGSGAKPNGGGCTECIVWQQCSESNGVLSRAGAVVILRSLLGLAIDEESLPMGPEEEGLAQGSETVILALPVPGVRDESGKMDDE